MNYAVNSASTLNYSRTPVSSPAPSSYHKPFSRDLTTPVRRITINVGGERFETYEETLARYPTSLLGSPATRKKFYDYAREEFVFPQCNKDVFNAILFFYQAKILSRPELIPLETFAKDVRFFGLTKFCDEVSNTQAQLHESRAEKFSEAKTFRNRVWNFIENAQTRKARWLSQFNLLLIFVWIVVQCAETQIKRVSKEARNSSDVREQNMHKSFAGKNSRDECLFAINTAFIVWFTIDYLLHIFTAPKVLHYIRSATGLIDLLTILPYYLALLAEESHITHYQVLTFLRIFKLFKASRYSSSLRILVGSLTSSAHDLPMWMLLVTIHLLFFSSIVFYVENETGNPQFTNIPQTMWFMVITMCAVGYGDIVPKSILGKLVTTFAAISGIVIVFCIPAPTLKHNFNRLNELYKNKKKGKRRGETEHSENSDDGGTCLHTTSHYHANRVH